jgi:hypothetical protein
MNGVEKYFNAHRTLFPHKKRIFSSSKGNRMERYFYGPVRKRFFSSERRNRMERYFYAPRTFFTYKEKDLLQLQKEQNGNLFSCS